MITLTSAPLSACNVEVAYMSTLTNSEDPDEMLHNAEFNEGLHCSVGSMQRCRISLLFSIAMTVLR